MFASFEVFTTMKISGRETWSFFVIGKRDQRCSGLDKFENVVYTMRTTTVIHTTLF